MIISQWKTDDSELHVLCTYVCISVYVLLIRMYAYLHIVIYHMMFVIYGPNHPQLKWHTRVSCMSNAWHTGTVPAHVYVS